MIYNNCMRYCCAKAGLPWHGGFHARTRRSRFTVTGEKSEAMSEVDGNLIQDQPDNGVASNPYVESIVPAGYVPQAEVDRVVGAVKAKTEARIRGEYEAMQGNSRSNIDPSTIAEQVFTRLQGELQAKEAAREAREAEVRQQQEFDKFRESLRQKLQVGVSEYPDFDDKVSKFNSKAYGDVLRMAHDLPNTSDVMYSLSQDRKNCAAIQNMVNSGDLEGAWEELNGYSKAVDSNKRAKTAEPYSAYQPTKIKASSAGSGSKIPTAAELHDTDLDWLRG